MRLLSEQKGQMQEKPKSILFYARDAAHVWHPAGLARFILKVLKNHR